MKKLLPALCFILNMLCVSGAMAQFVHPGLSNTQVELDKIKLQVNTGTDVARTAGWNVLINHASASLTYVANPRAIVYANSNTSGNFGLDALSAYAHALRWYVTGNQAYADKAISILNGYSNQLTDIVTESGSYVNQYVLVTAWAAATFCDAAEILRYSNAGWATADITKFENLCKNVFYPHISNHSNENGNWEASQINSLLAIGVFCNDQTIYNMGISWYRGTGKGAVGMYVYESGECQETCRDQYHSAMGLGDLVEAAEIAWHQGTDLYSDLPDPVTGMPRLAEGLEYTAKVVNGISMPTATCGNVIETNWSFGNQPMWEKAWNHYGNRMGRTDMASTKTSAEIKGRPAGISAWTGQYGWQTATHADLSVASADMQAPTSPSNLLVTGVTDTTASLSWTASTDNVGVIGYDVYQNGTLKTTVTTTNVTIPGLSAATTYTYTVKAKDAAGNTSVSSNSVDATTTTPTATTQTFNPVADAYVFGGSTKTNYGSATNLQVKYNGTASYTRKSFVKFDLTGKGISSVTNAKVRLYASSVSGAGNITVSQTTDSWTETSIKYSSCPATGASISNVSVSSLGYYEWDITSYIQSQLSANDLIVSLVFNDLASGNQLIDFNSREATSNKPELVIVSPASLLPLKSANTMSGISQSPLSIDHDFSDGAFKIYPNPSNQNGSLTIDFGRKIDKADIDVFDISGKQILKKTVHGESKTTIIIDRVLYNGIYFVRLSDGKMFYNQKLEIAN